MKYILSVVASHDQLMKPALNRILLAISHRQGLKLHNELGRIAISPA